jgi:hypothetical protein
VTSADDRDPAALRLARELTAYVVQDLVWEAVDSGEWEVPGYELDAHAILFKVRAEVPVLRDDEEFVRLVELTRGLSDRALSRLVALFGSEDDTDPAASQLVRWSAKFRDERLAPFLRNEFAAARNALYGTDFHLFGDSAADSDSFAPNSSFTGLLRATERVMNAGGGSVGLAGPRGAGKTSAMEAYLSRRLRGRGESRELTVHLSAPTQYDAREFMLHLQATLCRKVLAARGSGVRPIGRRTGVLSWLVLVGSHLIPLAFVFLSVFYIDGLWQYLTLPERRRDVWVIPGVLVVAFLVAGLAGELLRGLRFFARPVANLAAWQDSGTRRLRKEAEHLLRQARYLHTQTSGWSGKVPLPLKAEAGWTRTRQYARLPLTYPEVVYELRLFIARCAEVHGTVVIGIDELDKISSPQQAEAFVNELKGIFGVTNCVFVVTVSEDALAAFERRGVSVRDAFDSAFDEIVRVDHLGLDESTGILNTRLPGLPVVFQALCHCLSGGLPRELVRVARHVAEFEGREVTLRTVCSELVRSDLLARSHGVRVAAARLGAEQDVSDFLQDLLRLADAPEAPDLVRTARRMLPKESGSYTALDRLRWEASALCYFFATLLEVFTDALDEDRIKAAVDGSFGELAAARNALAENPQVAAVLLGRFRAAWGLEG